jgi:hypothetical protein
MSPEIQTSIDRLTLYLSRVKRDLETGNRAQMLADLAELGEISRRLWNRIAKSKL